MIHVLIRLPNHVGDACMALPAVLAIRDAGLACTLVGSSWGESLFASLHMPYLVLRRRRWSDMRRVRQLRRRRLTDSGDAEAARQLGVRGLLLPNSFGSALLFRCAGVPCAGHTTDGRRILLRWPSHTPVGAHEVERFHAAASAALRAWGRTAPEIVPPTLGLDPTNDQTARAQQVLRSAGIVDAFALLAPVATGLHHGNAKHWGHFAELPPLLRERGLQIVAAPPPNEIDAVRAVLPSATLLPPMPLGVYAALARQSAIVIANDSGSSHVAAAVGARQVTIFGVTDRKRTGPWSPRAICVGDNGAWPEVAQVVTAIDQALALP